jgi:hypothetical protein
LILHSNALRPVFLVAFFATVGLFVTACASGAPTDITSAASLPASITAPPAPTVKPTPRYKPADAKGKA